jgi:hypothetical protein
MLPVSGKGEMVRAPKFIEVSLIASCRVFYAKVFEGEGDCPITTGLVSIYLGSGMSSSVIRVKFFNE